jgi:hypothetical protein
VPSLTPVYDWTAGGAWMVMIQSQRATGTASGPPRLENARSVRDTTPVVRAIYCTVGALQITHQVAAQQNPFVSARGRL